MKSRSYLKEFYRDTFALHHWMMTAKSIDYWDELEQTQWYDPERLRQMQLEKLRRLIVHAGKNVPYYRKLFAASSIQPGNISGFEDFSKIPLLDKGVLKSKEADSLLADDLDRERVLRIRTSGSTGMPLHIYVDIAQLDYRYAAVLRSWGWTGWEIGDKSIRLWHQTIGMNEEQIKKEWLDAFLLSRQFLPVFEMDDKNLMKYILEISNYKPKMMDGYAEAFDILSRFIIANNMDDVHVPSVISSAQMLTPDMRQLISKAMHTEIFDRYGCREFSTVGHECEKHAGFHVNAENLFVEILKNGKPAQIGEIGEVVITDLHNYCQPLIRYRIGDLAERIDERCSCGRGLPLIGKIFGRTKGVVIGVNGRYLTTSFFLHYLKDFDDDIRQFQIIQENPLQIEIKIIPQKAKINDSILHAIKVDFKKYLGDEMNIHFAIVDKIKMVETGKHQAVISRVELKLEQGSEIL